MPGPSSADPQERESWSELIARFETYDKVPQANASAALLRRTHDEWADRVQARPWMHSLVFIRRGEQYPFDEQVRVEWSEGVYHFTLSSKQSRGAVTEDKCFAPKAELLLRSFLLQLVGDPTNESAVRQAALVVGWQKQGFTAEQVAELCTASGWSSVETIKALKKYFALSIGEGKLMIDGLQDPATRKASNYLRFQAELSLLFPDEAHETDVDYMETSTGWNKKLWALLHADRYREIEAALNRFDPQLMTFPPMPLSEAREVVLAEISSWEVDIELMDELTTEYDFGWLFACQSSEFIRTGNMLDMAVGHGPFLVDKFTGVMWVTGSAFPAKVCISNYQATGNPMLHSR